MSVSATLAVRFVLEVHRVRKLLVELPGKYELKGKFIQECCQHILDIAISREKPLSDDHIKQIAVKWCKDHKQGIDDYWREWNRQPTVAEWEVAEKLRLAKIQEEVLGNHSHKP